MPRQSTSEISMKSTKAELFQAYGEMKQKFEQSQNDQLPLAQQAVIKKEENRILGKTAAYVPENLENEINSLKKKIQANLEGTQEQLIAEGKKLGDIRKAIEIESKRLEEIYNIKLASDTLQTLISDYDAKLKELEKKKSEEENLLQEEISNQKKQWEREQEDHKYNLKIERKKEHDQYEIEQVKKRAQWQESVNKKEVELEEREKELNNRAEEIENMKKQIAEFPKKIEAAVSEAKQKAEKIMQKNFDVQSQILEQKRKAEKDVLEAKINNLQEVAKSQAAEIGILKKSLSEANQRAQDLATTIVENASGNKKLQELFQKEKESAKSEN